jgi:signal transduction histidine kinase
LTHSQYHEYNGISSHNNLRGVYLEMVTRAVEDSSHEGKSAGTNVTGAGRAVPSRRGLNAYIAGITLTAAALTAILVMYRPFSSPADIILGAVFLTLICIAGLYPIHVAPKTKISVTTAAVFATVLLFDPLMAVIVAGGGVAISQFFVKKKSWPNRIFSIAQSVLFTGTAALVYAAMGTFNASPVFISAYGIFRAITAAVAMYLVNSAAVSAAAGFQLHKNPIGIWVAGSKQAVVQELALVTIGLASAMIAEQAPWAIVLMLAPVVVIFYSFNRMAALNMKVESQLDELKATQAKMVESARMASIGTMVAGIAHQINNPMFVIRGRAETLCEEADEHLKTPSARRAVQVIFEMADRVSRIVNSLIPNSQVSEEGIACCDVNEVGRNTLLLLEPKLLKSCVEVSTALAEGLPPCMGDACEMQEMLINLVDNACNAMPQGGKLSIATRETDSGISIRISDTGLGITPDNLTRVFSPFFTTRKGSGGVGLGLYVSKHIAEKYGGSISVSSKVGAGAAFTISLPSGAQKTLKAERHSPMSRLVASGSGNPRRER